MKSDRKTERERERREEEREKEADPINSRKTADPSFMLLSQRFVGQTNALIDLRFYSYVSARVEKKDLVRRKNPIDGRELEMGIEMDAFVTEVSLCSQNC